MKKYFIIFIGMILISVIIANEIKTNSVHISSIKNAIEEEIFGFASFIEGEAKIKINKNIIIEKHRKIDNKLFYLFSTDSSKGKKYGFAIYDKFILNRYRREKLDYGSQDLIQLDVFFISEKKDLEVRLLLYGENPNQQIHSYRIFINNTVIEEDINDPTLLEFHKVKIDNYATNSFPILKLYNKDGIDITEELYTQ